jgi:hypothetical protein
LLLLLLLLLLTQHAMLVCGFAQIEAQLAQAASADPSLTSISWNGAGTVLTDDDFGRLLSALTTHPGRMVDWSGADCRHTTTFIVTQQY